MTMYSARIHTQGIGFLGTVNLIFAGMGEMTIFLIRCARMICICWMAYDWLSHLVSYDKASCYVRIPGSFRAKDPTTIILG